MISIFNPNCWVRFRETVSRSLLIWILSCCIKLQLLALYWPLCPTAWQWSQILSSVNKLLHTLWFPLPFVHPLKARGDWWTSLARYPHNPPVGLIIAWPRFRTVQNPRVDNTPHHLSTVQRFSNSPWSTWTRCMQEFIFLQRTNSQLGESHKGTKGREGNGHPHSPRVVRQRCRCLRH